jgi:hypothetical protein
MKTKNSTLVFAAICISFSWFSFIAGGIYFNSTSFAQQNQMHEDNRVKYLPDLKNWSETSQSAVKDMIKKYGMPAEATQHSLIWINNSPWKRTIIYDKETRHLFPIEHGDVMEQVIDYKVPLNKFNDLLLYDGSLIVKRTEGEMSVKCDNEAINFLAVNLANEVATGKRSVAEARIFYANALKDFILSGKASTYMQSLQFACKGKTYDADRLEVNASDNTLITKRIKEIKKERKEKEKESVSGIMQ